jgi:gamma-glutamylcyclotransferase (GGCT)/AIG2-like uncharacterized protein YtfP
MARQETDREDLLRDATAFIRRAEWTISGPPSPLFAGIRRNGSLSLYFDQDPVYQFNAEGRLRRAFVGGKLYRTQGETLAELDRVRDARETQLRRRNLGEGELSEFRREMHRRLEELNRALVAGEARLMGCVPDGDRLGDELPGRIEVILIAEPWLAPPIAAGR